MTGSQILRELLEMFGHTCPSKATIYKWIERFVNGDEDIHDTPNLAVRLLLRFGRTLKLFKEFWTKTDE